MRVPPRAKRIFTHALAFWLSGIVVLFCCGAMPTEAASAEIESCPLAKKGHCTKNAEANSQNSFEKEPPPTFDCCAFPAKIFDKARKLGKSPESPTVAATAEIAAPRFFTAVTNFKSPPARFHQSFVRNRGGTHLRNCVFRI